MTDERRDDAGAELLTDYYQMAPDEAWPYLLRDRTAKGSGVWAGTEPELMIVSRHHRDGWRLYDPFAVETGLFRMFADVDPTPEGCLEFANRFGCLGGSAEHRTREQPADEYDFGEPVRVWRAAILWMRYLVRLWEAARAKDAAVLSSLVRWEGFCARFLDLPPERHPHLPLPKARREADYIPQHFLLRRGLMTPLDFSMTLGGDPGQRVPNRTDLATPAMVFCAVAVDDAMQGLLDWRLVWSERLRRPVSRIVPKDLWGAMLYQFSSAIDGARNYHRCPVCRRWFELAPGLNRANKLFCSASCRTRATRQKQERAVLLHKEGKSVREIAEEIGSEVKFVKAWIKGTTTRRER